MAYIGKSPTGTGVRQRYYFTATGGETSLSGTDDNGLTLSYSDGAYVDVLLNGIELVAGTDYNTSTANTIAGLSALAASDIVTVTVYDIFTVADTVSAKDGGTFSSNVTFNGNINAGTIKDATGANSALTIASSGIITNGQPVGFKIRMQNSQAVTTGTLTKVQFDSTVFDTKSGWDATNYKYTIPSGLAGYWMFYAHLEGNNTGTENVMYLSKVNAPSASSDYYARIVQGENATTAQNLGIQIVSMLNLSAGDDVYVHFQHNYGSNVNLLQIADYDRSYFLGWRMF